jgi:alkanesulfonate monooxygenase SsuD/methylene tetrahydromethanopterin reductase-like flavin-dependent oxidoreductase (luciferase family)
VRDIWAVHERPVDHDGRFYRMRLAALDDLVAAPQRAIPIVVAGANSRMVEAAGRVADGVLAHTLCSPKYLREVVRPALDRGARHAGRDPRTVKLITYTLACASDDPDQARADAAAMIAFYGSVRSYAPLFEIHGFGPEAAAIQAAFRAGDAAAMVGAVTPAMVDALALAGTPADVRAGLTRFDGLVDEVVLSAPSFRVPAERIAENLMGLATGVGGG